MFEDLWLILLLPAFFISLVLGGMGVEACNKAGVRECVVTCLEFHPPNKCKEVCK